MKTCVKNSVLALTVAAVALAAAIVPQVSSAVPKDAGWKMRGGGGGSGSSAARTYSGGVRTFAQPSYDAGQAVRSFSYQPAPAAADYRSYSYAPGQMQTNVGQTVEVAVPEARIMRGTEVLGTLQQGESFRVIRSDGGWLGTVIERDGQRLSGWVWSGNVSPAGGAYGAPAPLR